ncbi:sterol desaturase family protein [soil metagenome]
MLGFGAKILLWAFPFLLLLIYLESVWFKRLNKGAYAWGESLASLGVAVGFFLTSLITIGVTYDVFNWVWLHRAATVPLDTWWGLALLFFGVEFFYYWQHRFSHEIRWFWASHAVHHSPQHLNLSASYRLAWTARLSGVMVFFLPLVWLGFEPKMILVMVSVNLLYQFWLHTELIPKLSWFEFLFNTPSHHRVHHATNVDYLDRNYGGVLIVFDRLFGSFAAERDSEPCRYGLIKQIRTNNPFRIAFHEWVALVRDVAGAKSLREVLGHLFGKPGWQADGKGMTTDNLRRASQVLPSVPEA